MDREEELTVSGRSAGGATATTTSCTRGDGTREVELLTCGDGEVSLLDGGASINSPTNGGNTLFGRPKGTTEINLRHLKNCVELATTWAATEYIYMRKEAKERNSRVVAGTLTKIIEEAKARHGVSKDHKISRFTVRTRAKRLRPNPGIAQGTVSPMLPIEPYVVDLIIQLAKMQSPINVTTGLRLVNSLIAGTPFETQLQQWKVKHNAQARTLYQNHGNTVTATGRELGWGYWQGFMKRNGHLVRSKKGVKFESRRADWCTHHNFRTMYDEVYSEMVKGGIAVKYDDSSWVSKDGKRLNNDTNAFGLPTAFNIVRPDKLLFVDEVGSNTSQSKDGNVGGEKFLCEKLHRPQIRSSTKDSHFTVLGFMSAAGVPLMCSIVFAAKEMEESWVLGFDADAEWNGDEDNIEANCGRGKRYPMGPTCMYNGKSVPAFCCCSDNGSITAELLVDMLSSIDRLGVFDRSDGVPPFLLLDGHGSRFDIKFLEYINSATTNWNVCIGVPYGTIYWQVGDSTEQNGCFKMSLTKHKRDLMKKKERQGIQEFAIEKEDVVDLVARAWDDSFARIDSNKQAIAERGWNPLNYNCLLNPEIRATMSVKDQEDDRRQRQQQQGEDDAQQQSTTNRTYASSISAELLNINQGLAGSLVDAIVETRMREDVRNGINLEENGRKRKQTALDAIAAKKRYTAGLHVAAGRFRLGPEVLETMRERKKQQQQQECERQEKRLHEFKETKNKVMAIRALGKEHAKLNVAQLKTLVAWYKLPDDPPIPATRALLLTRLLETSSREDPFPPFQTTAMMIATALPPPEEGQQQQRDGE